jgi:Zn-dependent protease with chaperone function
MQTFSSAALSVGATVVWCFLTGSALVGADDLRRPKHGSQETEAALRWVEAHQTETIAAFLRRLRPEPLDAELRRKVIARLPDHGELVPTQSERHKLDAAQEVIDFGERTGLITIKVIDVDHAFVGLHARSAVLASRQALSLLNEAEFAALVAHELGHEFVWSEYWEAMKRDDHRAMRVLELRCDVIGVLTLRALRRDPEKLVSAVQKMTRYNEARGTVASAADYVDLDERVRLIRTVAVLGWTTPPISDAIAAAVPSPAIPVAREASTPLPEPAGAAPHHR